MLCHAKRVKNIVNFCWMEPEIFLSSSLSSSTPKRSAGNNTGNLVTPGELIAEDKEFMRGHGTYKEDGKLFASVAGLREKVNKLVHVNPVKCRYNGEVGDVVVGRITEVGQRRWKVETNSRLDSVLHLAGVNLPGGELRRKSQEDELMMRQYLQEGDLISAEVQMVSKDGSMTLHTRSLKYGKLGQGVLVKVSPSLIKRRKSHFHNLPCGATIILGNNGYVWICPPMKEDEGNTGGFVQNLDPVFYGERSVISRLRNCILILAEHRIMLFDTSIVTAFDLSMQYEKVKDLLRPDVSLELAKQIRAKLTQEDITIN